MDESLFVQIGGAEAVDAAVDIFYRKVLSDESIAMFFENTDMEEQLNKQKGFLTMAFGGPNKYSGQDMRTAHAPLVAKGLNESHFTAVATHLQETLVELDVPQALIDQVMAIAGSTHDDVLGL
jgi:hemoglobin